MTARLAAATAALLLAFVAPAAAEPVTETADAGPVHAELSYDKTTDPELDLATYAGYHLRVTNGGATVVDADVPDSDGYVPGGAVNERSLTLADLDGDGTTEVLVDLYSGGAHCCFETRVYSGAADPVRIDWRDVGYRLTAVGGDQAFVSGDVTFEAAFTSYAATRFPLQVWAWRGDGFIDITRRAAVRPRLRAEAKRWRRDYDRAHGRLARGHGGLAARETVRSALAAYAADEGSLGRPQVGLKLLTKAVARKELSKGQARAIRKLLRRQGYLR